MELSPKLCYDILNYYQGRKKIEWIVYMCCYGLNCDSSQLPIHVLKP